jgi:transcriptional regulator with XRE-family HTH domain
MAPGGLMVDFAGALRDAIQARGLGLERIQERLRAEGYSVSLATLSYWQTGRSRPERRESLAALAELEKILEVEPGSLVALVGPPRPRGRHLHKSPDTPELGAFWSERDLIVDLAHGIDTRWDERLTRLSQHDRVNVGPDRGEVSFLVRQVLRAEADGPDRWVAIIRLDVPGNPLPLLTPVRNCRMGRVVEHPESGLLLAELLFDRPLAKGETVITEHALHNYPPFPVATQYERKFRLPVREYVVEVCFDPAALPRAIFQFQQMDGQDEQVLSMDVDAGHSVHAIALDYGPGRYGLRWDWE